MAKRIEERPSIDQLEEFANAVKASDAVKIEAKPLNVKRIEFHGDNTPQKIIYYSVSN